MFRKRKPTGSGTPGNSLDQSRPKRQRVAEGTKMLLDIAKESSDWFAPLKSALGGVCALVKHYEQFEDVKEKIEDLIPRLARFKQNANAAVVDGDQAEKKRRSELLNALEEITKRSQELQAKGVAARFIDKGEDAKEVVKLIEKLQEAIIHYQISQQQAIYGQITDLTSSFGVFLKLHEISPSVKTKLDSVLARLGGLCPEDSDDALLEKNERERWRKLFRTLKVVKDNAAVLYDRVSAQGYEECQDDILAVSELAEDIRDALLEYQTIQQRAIYDQNCRLINTADMSVLNSCRRARRATHHHLNRRGCLRGTRETVLNEIEAWTRDFGKSPVFWLNGLAGTGKSTIAQTISERLFADDLLGASFFCSRDFEDRSDLRFIFPTLAFQLAHKYPDFRSQLVFLLQSNPDVVDESLYGQMEKLIVEPLRSTDVSTVILIDALDECKDDEPSSAILSVLGRFVERIPTVKFFITGRPEPRIKTGFRLPLLVDATNVFVLHDVHPSLINNDIRLFLKRELSELAQRNQLDGWPTDESVDLLCKRAAGLFVYAMATVKYLNKKFYLPDKQLETIINFPDSTEYEGKTSLDPLYLWILGDTFCVDDTVVLTKIRTVIGAVVLLVNPLPPSGIGELVGLEAREVSPFLTSLQSLLVLDEDPTQPVKPFHKSFPDFITDPSRCTDARFYISPERSHLELVTHCLRVMNGKLEQNLLSLPDYALNSEVKDLEARVNDHISVALRYACKSWYRHLPETRGDVGDVTDVVSHLRVFLRENFLAWLEVVSVLGATRGAVAALERLIPWLEKVSWDGELLNIARDCFRFVTTYFEPINVSAVHIYHSALELSPFSSNVRRLYHHRRRHTPFPRVVAGTQVFWDQSSTTRYGGDFEYRSFTWSPCGQFVAVNCRVTTEIRDPLTSELLSTLHPTESVDPPIRSIAYSPDGRSLASIVANSLIIWDIQTGGVAKEVECGPFTIVRSMVWSSDGRAIGVISSVAHLDYFVHVYDVDSGAAQFHHALQSNNAPHLWAYNESFRIMTTGLIGQTLTINISEVGSVLTKIETFCAKLSGPGAHIQIGQFSPTTYQIAVWVHGQLNIFDIENWGCLLSNQRGLFDSCFSSDGSLFAAASYEGGCVLVWKYGSNRYSPWRMFPTQNYNASLQFSPDFSSIAGWFSDLLRVWRLDSHSPVAYPDGPDYSPFAVLSQCGTYVVTSQGSDGTVAITNLLSKSPSQFIDTGIGHIEVLALTGNVLLVKGREVIIAWRLTEEGVVYGLPGGGRADRGDAIWVLPSLDIYSTLSIQGQTAVMKQGLQGGTPLALTTHAYHTGTGEELELARSRPQPRCRLYSLSAARHGLHYHHCRSLEESSIRFGNDWPVSRTTLEEEGWVKDLEGRHRLWIPPTWRLRSEHAGWHRNIATLWFNPQGRTVIVMF